MGVLVKGDLVLGKFPNSGTNDFKQRPGVVLASWRFGTWDEVLVCMITSKKTTDPNAFEIGDADLVYGNFPAVSYIRPCYLCSGNESHWERKGALKPETLKKVVQKLVDQITS